MITKLLTSESKTVTGAALLIGCATLLSRGIGIIRDRVFAHSFGAGPIMDAYYASFKIPDLLYNLLIVGALTAGFIPTFTRLLSENKSSAWKLANNIVTIVAVVLVVISGVGILVTPHLIPALFTGFNSETTAQTIAMTRIMLLSPLLLGISMVMGGILQSLRQFLLYSFAPVLYNLGIIAGTLLLVPHWGPVGLAWGVVLGALLHMSLQIIGAYKNGYRWQWSFNLRDTNTKRIGHLMIPRTLGLGLSQLNIILITVLAAALPAGSIAVYNFANNLQAVPTGIIAIPFALAIFPILSSLAGKENHPAFIAELHRVIRKILFFIIPAMVVLLLLRAQIVRVILGSGAFDWADTIATADALAFFALGLAAQALIPLFARAFYALNNTKTPFLISVLSETVTLFSALLLMGNFGVAGLALASTLGTTLNVLLMAVFLRKKLGYFNGSVLLIFICKIAVSAIVMGVTIQLLKYPLSLLLNLQYFWGIFLQGLFAGLGGILMYILMLFILKVQEADDLIGSMNRKWLKFSPVKEGMDEAETL